MMMNAIIKKVAAYSIVIMLIATLFLCLTISVNATTGADAETNNLNEAMAKYNIDYNNVIPVDNVEDLKVALTRAGEMASNEDRYIVYAMAGTYSIDDHRTYVPSNVLLVAENDTKFRQTADANQMIKVAGSVYGGSYDGNYKATSVLYFDSVTFSGNNGIIERVNVTGGKKEGIIAMHPGSRRSQVLNSTIYGCRENGICIQKGAQMQLISGCNSSNNNYSGINISHADVGVIENCIINNNGDKAVSTNSDPIKGYDQPGCTIDAIKNCTIKGNKKNGVYIKPKCTLKSFTGNLVEGNNDGLVASAKTAAGTKGSSVIYNVSNNTFRGNTLSQICSGDSGAIIYIKSNNKIQNGKNNGIYIKNGGVIKITGDNNEISGNKKAGISVAKNSKLIIEGKKTKISKNGKQGIYAVGCKEIRIKGANTTIISNKEAGISVIKGSKLFITGKNTAITKNGRQGIYANSKAYVSAKSKVVKMSGNKKGNYYKAGGAKIKGIKKK